MVRRVCTYNLSTISSFASVHFLRVEGEGFRKPKMPTFAPIPGASSCRKQIFAAALFLFYLRKPLKTLRVSRYFPAHALKKTAAVDSSKIRRWVVFV